MQFDEILLLVYVGLTWIGSIIYYITDRHDKNK